MTTLIHVLNGILFGVIITIIVGYIANDYKGLK